VGRSKELLEVDRLAVLRDGEEGEDPAAVVVQDHDRPAQPVAAGRQQAAEVVQQGEVTGEEHSGPDTGRRGAQCARHHAVDSVCAAVGEDPRAELGKGHDGVEVAHRHAVGDVEDRVVGKPCAELTDSARLEEPALISQAPVDRPRRRPLRRLEVREPGALP